MDTPPLVNLEATAIRIVMVNDVSYEIVSAYCPPAKRLLSPDLDAFFGRHPHVIVAGDLNAKHRNWNSWRANASGNILDRYATTNNLFVHGPDRPTHYGAVGRPDVLDIAIVKDIRQDIEIEVLDELDSDHVPVLMRIGQDIVQLPATFTKTNWPAYNWNLQSNVGPVPVINSVEEADNALEKLTSSIQDHVRSATTTHAVKDHNSTPLRIRDLITAKHRARKRWHRTQFPGDKREYNRLTIEVKQALREKRNEDWHVHLASLNTQDNSLWKTQKALRKKRTSIPPIHGLNGMAYSDSDKAEAFADNLESQCTPLEYDSSDEDDQVDLINGRVRRLLQVEENETITPTSPLEIRTLIKKTKVKTAPGNDGISNRALRHLPPLALVWLCTIINAALRFRYFPKKWRCADVILIPKPGGNRTFPQDYRPISLLPTMSKIAEKVILSRLCESSNDLNVIQDEQFGFRPFHSTVQQAVRVVEFVADAIDHKDCAAGVFLDVSKAFDKVWHQGLLYKMITARYPLSMVKLICSFLTRRSFRVKIEDEKSTPRRVLAGVPQGATLSPHLFTIFTSDMPKTEATSLFIFADDTGFMASCRDPRLVRIRLQNAADNLERWFKRWRIAVNATKSAAVFFTKRPSLQRPPNIVIFGQDIPWKDDTRYLGLTIDKGLTWKPHIEGAVARARAAYSALYPLFSGTTLDLRNKLLLYKTVIRPIMTYAAPAWGYAAPTHIKKLQTVQNKILRTIVNAPWFVRNRNIHEDLQMISIQDFIREAAAKFYDATIDHDNPTIRGLWGYNVNETRLRKRPKLVLDRV